MEGIAQVDLSLVRSVSNRIQRDTLLEGHRARQVLPAPDAQRDPEVSQLRPRGGRELHCFLIRRRFTFFRAIVVAFARKFFRRVLDAALSRRLPLIAASPRRAFAARHGFDERRADPALVASLRAARYPVWATSFSRFVTPDRVLDAALSRRLPLTRLWHGHRMCPRCSHESAESYAAFRWVAYDRAAGCREASRKTIQGRRGRFWSRFSSAGRAMISLTPCIG